MKQKVLLVGDYFNGTGFHRVVAHIKNAIKNDFEIHHIGIGYHDEIFTSDDGITIYPETSENGGQYGHRHIARLIDQIQPDIFFIVYDLIYVRYLLESLRHKSRNMIRGAYLALDGEIIKRRKMISPLKELDFCIWYTDFAHNHIQDILKEQGSLLRTPVDFRIIPHGVESSRFYPIADNQQEKRRIARKAIFPDLKNPEDTFIVLNANRPTPRKRIDLTLKAFAEFAKDKSSDAVKLYLHHSFTEGLFNRFTTQLLDELNLRPYLLKGPLAKDKEILSNEELNLVYNACDVGINTCMGEGWGLTNFEHAATKAPQILPHHSCFPGIWQGAALWASSLERKEVSFSPHYMYQAHPDEFAYYLEKLYQDKEARNYYANQAYKKVTQEAYQWSAIETQWKQLFQQYSKHPRLKSATKQSEIVSLT